MFKKIWQSIFGTKEFVDTAIVRASGELVYPVSIVVADEQAYDKEEAQKPSRMDILEKPLQANVTVLNSNYYNGLKKAYDLEILPPAADVLYKASAESARVYLYNISPLTHEKEHPILKNVVLPECELGEKYQLAFSIPDLMVLTMVSVDGLPVYGKIETQAFTQDGKRVAMDIVNPENLGLDQKLVVMSSTSDGTDLGKRGVFWSLNNPPRASEIKAARLRMEKHYKEILEKISVLLMTSVRPFADRLEFYKNKGNTPEAARFKTEADFTITPEHHAAADYFRLKTVWHPVLKPLKRKKTQ